MNIIGIIPARLKSTRLPDKMLAKINGITLVEHVYNNASRAKTIKKLFVATDSVKIKQVIEKAGGNVIMTSKSCKSGTERIKEALKSLKANMNDIVINIQGDEPLLEPALIDKTVQALMKDTGFDAATLASPITDSKEISDPSVVKVVTGSDNEALYFSRASIPFSRDGKVVAGALKHVGLYAYRKGVLDLWNRLKSKYENIEKLEQLRVIENGLKMKVVIGKSRSIGVDTKKDLAYVRRILKN